VYIADRVSRDLQITYPRGTNLPGGIPPSTRRLSGCQLLRQPVQASRDQLPVLVIAKRADPSLRAMQVLARPVEIAERAVALSQVEVQ
jgi:hypothetical protein